MPRQRHGVQVTGDHDPLGTPEGGARHDRVAVPNDLQVRQRGEGSLDGIRQRPFITTH